MPPDGANTAGCTNLCRGLRFTSSTSFRGVLVDRPGSTISLGPVRVAICTSLIASRWKRQAFIKWCHSSILAPTNGTPTSAGTAISSPGSRQSVERPLTRSCSITNAEPRFVKLKRCSISFRRAMSGHSQVWCAPRTISSHRHQLHDAQIPGTQFGVPRFLQTQLPIRSGSSAVRLRYINFSSTSGGAGP